MMHRFLSLKGGGNTDFFLVRELLFEECFEWLSSSGNLMGIQSFEDSFNQLNKKWKHFHRPFEMTVKLIDEKKINIEF